MCLCSPELDLYCRPRTFLINNVAYIRSLWSWLGSWMLKTNFIPCTFFKSFTLLFHTNWHRKIGSSIWLSPMQRCFLYWIHAPEECYTSNDCAFLCISCCWQCLGPSILLMYLGVYMWCIFPEFEYIKLYSVMDVNIYILFFCNLCALAFSDVLLEWWEARDVLKSGFLEGKKIKRVCFYVSALGRCKVSGKREVPEE